MRPKVKAQKWHYAVVTAVLIFTLILLFYPSQKGEPRIFVPENQSKYAQVLSEHVKGREVVLTPLDSALGELSHGDGAFVSAIQAQPYIAADSNYHFVPHIAQTVVITIDRDETDTEINSFADLLKTEYAVTFDLDDRFETNDWGTPKAQQIILSMAYALDPSYDIRGVGQFMGTLWDEERFHYQDMWKSIVITVDSVAAEYIERGRNSEVILPSDGAFTLEYGLLYYGEPPSIEQGMNKALVEAGYRLPNGMADSTLYPADYTNAKIPPDGEAYRSASAQLGAVIRRTAFIQDLYNFANIVEYTALFLGFLLFCILYLFSIKRRITDKSIANALVLATCTAILFVVIGILKYFVEDNIVLETLLWYSFYIPMYTMTASLVYVMMRAEHTVRPTNIARAIKWFKWYVYAEIAALILIFTNHYHQWVFIVTDYVHSYHSYNWGYAIVLSMMYIGILITLITLIRQCVHSPRKKMFLAPVIMVIVMLGYSCGHIFDFEPVLNFEISFAISLLAILFAELCMLSHIFPHNRGFKTLFLHSGLAMQIEDFDGNTVERSLITQQTDENYVLRQWDIAGGKFTYFEDQTSLNTTNRKLEQVNEMRRETNRLLLQKSKLQADLSAMAVQRQIYESIDEILLNGTQKIEQLSKDIEQNADSKRTMAKVSLLACIMKRTCMFHINLLHQQSQQVGIFLNTLQELSDYCLPFDLAVTVSCRTDKDLTGAEGVSMYSVCTSAVQQAIEQGASTLLLQLYEQDGKTILSALGDIPLFSKEQQQQLEGSLHEDMAQISSKPWEDTEIYLLTGSKEEDL